MTFLGVVVAGLVGAPARYVLDAVISERTRGVFPWGTLVVNVSGSLVLGFLSGLALYHGFPATAKTVLGTGFLGAYTTFSTFAYETLAVGREESRVAALAYVTGSVVAGVAAAATGLALAAAL
jgi:fluoride exporter